MGKFRVEINNLYRMAWKAGPSVGRRVIAQVGELYNQNPTEPLKRWLANEPEDSKRTGFLESPFHTCSSPPSPIDSDASGTISTQQEYYQLPVS